MATTRITEPRRRFVEIISQHTHITFKELKETLVSGKDATMDLATLYRIVDAFKKEGLIHEMKVAGERVIFASRSENSGDGVIITFCENCGSITDEHIPLPSNHTFMETHARVKSCDDCVIAS
ncbi:transcriptional repressor [Candidatus Gracilibacteria bacterium]|nr:transcriptional repressor [Candidatus Gracilibacteria bacterium]MBS9784304.1 transcriptional repressor [Candidatus Gracilibacteria bacterium]